jgi:hypothetical protein
MLSSDPKDQTTEDVGVCKIGPIIDFKKRMIDGY